MSSSNFIDSGSSFGRISLTEGQTIDFLQQLETANTSTYWLGKKMSVQPSKWNLISRLFWAIVSYIPIVNCHIHHINQSSLKDTLVTLRGTIKTFFINTQRTQIEEDRRRRQLSYEQRLTETSESEETMNLIESRDMRMAAGCAYLFGLFNTAISHYNTLLPDSSIAIITRSEIDNETRAGERDEDPFFPTREYEDDCHTSTSYPPDEDLGDYS